ncbi:folylpolyglutamate synthase/dihydrofolate synthase family protein [Lewinella sp. 4G2]|uniref:bifunctional folylpolyglutamate synthase/dihydrofolate synthase n=1 Tax=Lewinella sp. 4G2 TaxID=1803372 RepID=UPI0007B47A82|nr:Mur ligase family protein [Lewinella sp. 4G2]OAV46100.1 hypothetical protein A3850_017725 [Lewinella sp. 4G2]
MTYQETLDYLFTQLPMYQRQGAAAMKKDLSNITALMDWLGNPHKRVRCIHVAGTNGKGTVCHLIAAALQQAGHRVGMYTSPHYKDFRERIKINGEFIPEQWVIDFSARLRAAELDIEPSFFEITVAMAFEYFAAEQPDFCVIEVGLGGRLDSTNIINPILSVITNIGLDHTQFLGDTLAKIAAEKAGIMKRWAPTLIGRRQEETTKVFKRLAKKAHSPLYYADDFLGSVPDYIMDREGGPPMYLNMVNERTLHLFGYEYPIYARTEAGYENNRTALAALRLLGLMDYRIPDLSGCSAAWSRLHELTYYVGRYQVIGRSKGPTCLADSAHNEDGLRVTMNWLASYEAPLYIVLGMVSDKDHDKALAYFPREARYYFAKADIPRGLPAEELAKKGDKHGLQGDVYPSVQAAYAAAQSDAWNDHRDKAVVFVGGSIFTVAEVL